MKKCFKSWKNFIIIKNFSKINEKKQKENLQKLHFSTWKKNIKFIQNFKEFKNKKIEGLLISSLISWKRLLSINYKKNQTYNKLKQFCDKKLKIKTITYLKMYLKRNKLSKNEEKNLMKKSLNFFKIKKRKLFFCLWKHWFYDINKINKVKYKKTIIYF